MTWADVEVKREEAAQRLAAPAAALADGNKVELALGASTVKVHVPDETRCEIELAIDGDELEVELKWPTGKPAADTTPATSTTTPARRSGTTSGRRARGPKR
ncbi:MAG: amphi-Trp domain-containing protein [Actinophytocola sp.]|uniref:amphi-Trp domain-containing protein n=1 Tax=Actinophytocola sp. TaxID=1872138 RepID=UPI001329FFBD|nr:amphi-Trp domain-containing protein [Actinophytocola sp.]MPZ80382.1 amphi-Trp domain-containing protein [Actinophytocola sp.]